MIYLDHAATSPLHPKAREAMTDAMAVLGNPSSPHRAGTAAKALLEDSRRRMAECLGCDPKELLFTSGGTEANALALHGRSKVLTSPMEHPSVLKNVGDPLLLPVTGEGVVSLAGLEEALRKGVTAVSLQHANNETGLLQPAEEAGVLCRRQGVVFHCDGVQAVGKAELCLRELPVDLYTFSAHKFGGPMGVGGLYRRAGTELHPLYGGGSQEGGFRAGTESALLAAGMAAALEAVTKELGETHAKLKELEALLLPRLHALGGVETGRGERIAGHLHLRFPGRDGEALTAGLDLLGVCISAGAACRSGSHTPSRTLLAMGFTPEEASEGLRITLGRENTREEILTFSALLEELIRK
ncbi:MAG: cysteine desulfurase [Ruminococcaceae bacterium]|nr:cysteine desulfurase [Oscillospiraceae bacterium]